MFFDPPILPRGVKEQAMLSSAALDMLCSCKPTLSGTAYKNMQLSKQTNSCEAN